MSTPIDICNLALGHIGKPEISSFEEASAEARECRRFYNQTRRAFLQGSDWTFARRRQALAEVTNDYGERWGYKYSRPSGILKMLRVLPPNTDLRQNPRPIRFEVREGAVFADIPHAVAEFIVDLTDTTRFGALAVDALAFALAHRIARPLTKSTKITAEMKDEAREYMSLAIEADASQDVGRYSYDADTIIDRENRPSPFWGN